MRIFTYYLSLVLVAILFATQPLFASDCGHNFARLDTTPTLPVGFSDISAADNRLFIQLGQQANLGKAPGYFFVNNENAVLKELNDKVVQDKDFVTALGNYHKSLLWNALRSDPEVKAHLVAKYSDFKTLRFVFRDMNPGLQEKISTLISNANNRFALEVHEIGVKRNWSKRMRGLTTDTRNWYHTGFGSSPDEAGLAARSSRYNLENGTAKPRSFSDIKPMLDITLTDIDSIGAMISKRFASVPGFLKESNGGKKVLSAETIDTIRKTNPISDHPEDWIFAVRQAIGSRFNILISDQDALFLRKYLTMADQFSPGLMQEERVSIDLGARSNGIVSVDFNGQNAHNTSALLQALADTEGKPLMQRIRAVRIGEGKATAELDEKKIKFSKVVKQLDPSQQSMLKFSGDDGIYLPSRVLSPQEKKELIKNYLSSGNAEDLRLTFVPAQYADSSLLISKELRSQFVVAAEGIEKKLRNSLVPKIPRKKLNNIMIAVDYYPQTLNKPIVGIYICTKDGTPISESTRQSIQESLARNGIVARFIDDVNATAY